MFLVELLRSSSVTIVENGGGILRNVSAHIAMADKGETYRLVLREEQCLGLLLDQLRSSSMTVVSNAAGTLWNLSARSVTDQTILIQLGALPILQTLTNSRHKSIATCAAAAIKNLHNGAILTSTHNKLFSGEEQRGGGLLSGRKTRNLVESLRSKLSESVETDSDESSQSGQSSEDEEESFLDSLSVDNVTKVEPENFIGNKLPPHTNGNYLAGRPDSLDTWDNNNLESPLDLRTKKIDSIEMVTKEDVHEMTVIGECIETKLDTPPESLFDEEKASFETMGEKFVESPPPFIISSSSFDSDSTKSFQEEGSPMSVQSSSAKEASDESEDDDNDVSEALLKDLISSAMPSADTLAPTPRSVWDSDNSNRTVIQHQEELRSQEGCVNVSFQSSDVSELELDCFQHCEDLHEDATVPVLDDLEENDDDHMVRYNVENSPAQFARDTPHDTRGSNVISSNVNINNNNKATPRKEATFVLDEAVEINDAANDQMKLKNINCTIASGPDSLSNNAASVRMRKSRSEHSIKRESQSEAAKRDYRRSWSTNKSPRTSRLIPGVVIKELKLLPRSESKTPAKESEDIEMKVELPEDISLSKEEEIKKEEVEVKIDIFSKDIKMTSSVISHYEDTISQIEEPSAMVDSVSLAVKPSLDGYINKLESLSLVSISHHLDSIRPPTLLDEITMNSHTLKADTDVKEQNGATYLVEEEEANTVDDVTDVFDEESTLTPRCADDIGDVPELPLDSVHTTPTHSSSVTTPDTVRKIKTDVKERDDDTTSHLTYVIDNDDTSGYRSISTDIIDVDERLQRLVGEMYSWQMAPEEEDSMEMIETEARMMLETLTSSGLRSRSASVTSNVEEESRCSSIGILKETHIAKLELESELISGRAVTKIHDRDAITNKEFRRPKIPPKPPVLSFVQNHIGTAERNKSYLIATKNPQFETGPAATKPDATLPQDCKMPTTKEKRSLKFSKLWRRAEEGTTKPGLEIKASKIPLTSKPGVQQQPSDEKGSKSLISKTFRNFTLKRSGVSSGKQFRDEQNTTPPKDKRLGTSIVLLSPNDAEVVEKLEPRNPFPLEPVQTQVEYTKRDHSRTKVVSGREHLVPIIKNPRTKFLESERKNLTPAGGNYSRKLDFQDSIKNSSKKITASNKVTLV